MRDSMTMTSVLRAIRAKCIDCSGGHKQLVDTCHTKTCALWPYRMGKDPGRAGVGGNPNWKAKVA